MTTELDLGSWVLAVLAIPAFPVGLLTVCVVVVALLALAARSQGTRRHCLLVLARLSEVVAILRSKR